MQAFSDHRREEEGLKSIRVAMTKGTHPRDGTKTCAGRVAGKKWEEGKRGAGWDCLSGIGKLGAKK